MRKADIRLRLELLLGTYAIACLALIIFCIVGNVFNIKIDEFYFWIKVIGISLVCVSLWFLTLFIFPFVLERKEGRKQRG